MEFIQPLGKVVVREIPSYVGPSPGIEVDLERMPFSIMSPDREGLAWMGRQVDRLEPRARLELLCCVKKRLHQNGFFSR